MSYGGKAEAKRLRSEYCDANHLVEDCTVVGIQVQAVFSPAGGGPDEIRAVTLTYDGRVLAMKGGPTGHESFVVDGNALSARERMFEGGWLANFGSYRRYDRCAVPGSEMRRAFEALGLA